LSEKRPELDLTHPENSPAGERRFAKRILPLLIRLLTLYVGGKVLVGGGLHFQGGKLIPYNTPLNPRGTFSFTTKRREGPLFFFYGKAVYSLLFQKKSLKTMKERNNNT